jgi:LuxR family transcriptional regulator, maltose regulon positive regulatory protein
MGGLVLGAGGVQAAPPPPARAGIVPRTGLIERLLASDAVPVVCVVAPAGYGKTTLLAQWAQRTVHRVGWVSVDQRDGLARRCC